MKRCICALLAAVILVMALAACSPRSDRQMIEDRLNKYVSCINNMDYNGSLECMDSKTRAAMDSMMNLLGDLVGTDMNDIINIGSLFGSSDYVNMRLDSIDDIRIDGDTATVSFTLSATVNGETETQSTVAPMVKENGDWYISGGMNSLF